MPPFENSTKETHRPLIALHIKAPQPTLAATERHPLTEERRVPIKLFNYGFPRVSSRATILVAARSIVAREKIDHAKKCPPPLVSSPPTQQPEQASACVWHVHSVTSVPHAQTPALDGRYAPGISERRSSPTTRSPSASRIVSTLSVARSI